ncbi:MAG: hypothetical protein ACREFQ_11145, partial [Stellaceae bacterium]
AKVGLDQDATYETIAVMVAGIFSGSAMWWLGLGLAIAAIRLRTPLTILRTIQHVSGAILLLSGLGLLAAASLGLAAWV